MHTEIKPTSISLPMRFLKLILARQNRGQQIVGHVLAGRQRAGPTWTVIVQHTDTVLMGHKFEVMHKLPVFREQEITHARFVPIKMSSLVPLELEPILDAQSEPWDPLVGQLFQSNLQENFSIFGRKHFRHCPNILKYFWQICTTHASVILAPECRKCAWANFYIFCSVITNGRVGS